MIAATVSFAIFPLECHSFYMSFCYNTGNATNVNGACIDSEYSLTEITSSGAIASVDCFSPAHPYFSSDIYYSSWLRFIAALLILENSRYWQMVCMALHLPLGHRAANE